MPRSIRFGLATMVCFGCCLTAYPEPNTSPALPKLSRLEIEPARLTLDGTTDCRRVLVTGIAEDGRRFDLSHEAKLEVRQDIAAVQGDGFLRPRADGQGHLRVAAAGLQAEIPLTVKNTRQPAPVSFVRDVMPILTKVGCNAGTCHGGAKGKNGFRLSLRGYDPEFDYHALVDDLAGRRFNRADPAQSLMLLKPNGGVPHQGGFLLDPTSDDHAVLQRWIAEGVRCDVESQTRAARIEVWPKVVELDLPGRVQQVLAIAHYPDGRTRDVTRDANFTSSVADVATTTQAGRVAAVRRGEAALIVRYEGALAAVPIQVMGDRTGFAWQPQPEVNFIDATVYRKLQAVKILPSELCSDAEFIRRLHLDLTGQIPTPEQVRAFLADATPSQHKRERLVDELVGSPAFVDHWAHKWCDLLQVNRKFLGAEGMWAYHTWIRQAVAANMPYDQFVRALLTTNGNPHETATAAANFIRVNLDPKQATENTTQLFLGTRFSCCQCHDHPFEKWTQRQYFGLTAFFARGTVRDGELPAVFDRRDGGETLHPKTNAPVPPSTPYPVQAASSASATASRREALARWLTHPDNPLFARSMANRTWSYFFHRGIIDPVDDIRSSNPPSNPELLDALTAEFVKSGFDVQHLIRLICKSRVYQHGYRPNRWNEDDVLNFSRMVPRRLTAEQLIDSLMQATGSPTAFAGLPRGLRAAQLPDSHFSSGGFMEQFGKPARESSCECERSSEVSLAQAMLLINGPTLANGLADPKGRLASLLQKPMESGKLVEEMYLAAWSRPPTEAERAKAVAALEGSANKAAAAQDLFWALLNSPAFLFNY